MNLSTFAKEVSLSEKSEIDKVLYLTFFQFMTADEKEFSVSQISDLLVQLNYSKPNQSRLKNNLKKSRSFVNGSKDGFFKIQARKLEELKTSFPQLGEKSEEITHDEGVLPESLYRGTRGYIEKLSDQINSSYENNIFDGCAVLMRRLLEICLILSYEKCGCASEIKDGNGDNKMLQNIVSNAVANPNLSLSRNTKSCLETFRTLGNFSAHKIQYNAKKADIRKVKADFRACIEELLYKSGIIK